ncbi:uncharacterized protein LOC121046904 [Ixodes scapularis]|uniref:uncharacterized protein LOC121046904 n=1 Tax=Ixodes scapularis TaxID=6945 RepID=UPI001C3956A3|nr:uncharacterized protein LOC121046904 [Ixodes scapularis]
MALFLAEMSRLLQEQRRPLPPPVPTPRTGTLRLHAEIPKYSGNADKKWVADFLDELREYRAVSEMSEVELLSRVLPIALTGSAATWRRRQPPFSTLQDFSKQFKNEFLPPDYSARMLDELRARTQHRDESLVEFVRALQTLYDRADPSASDSDKVSRAMRQSHPQFHPYLRGRVFRSLDELAQAAHQIQADVLAELRYRPPPPPEACLEPSCCHLETALDSAILAAFNQAAGAVATALAHVLLLFRRRSYCAALRTLKLQRTLPAQAHFWCHLETALDSAILASFNQAAGAVATALAQVLLLFRRRSYCAALQTLKLQRTLPAQAHFWASTADKRGR